MGLSREVQALIAYVASTDLPHRVTSITGGRHAEGSRHYAPGTGGRGLAVDFAGPQPGDIPAMGAIYRALLERADQLHELIWSGPGADLLVRNRAKVVPTVYRGVLSAHRNHVHTSVDLGVFLAPVSRPAPAEITGVTGAVHDFEEAAVKTAMLTITLDDHGNGWADFDPVLGRDPIPVAVLQHGPSPPDDGGYWPEYAAMNLRAQQRDGRLRVTATGGPAGGKAMAWVTVA